jgi:phosphatidylglycerophosphatase C
VAAFDFDGTLTEGGSVFGFLVEVGGMVSTLTATLVLSPQIAIAAVLGGEHADRVKESLFKRVLGGTKAAEVWAKAEIYGTRHWAAKARPEVLARLKWHKAQGHRIAIVSASPECYIQPVGRILGADIVIATKLAEDDQGRLTGGYDGANCRGEQKLSRVNAWVEGSFAGSPGWSRPFLWAYGNSRGDKRLLTGADIGVDAGKLGRFGKLRTFTRLAELADGPG